MVDDSDESPEKALAREVFEETGLIVERESPFEIAEKRPLTERPGEKFFGYTYIVSFCRVRVIRGTLKINKKEHGDYRWVKIDRLTELKITQSTRLGIERFLDALLPTRR